MSLRCRMVQKRIQDHFDDRPAGGGLQLRDIDHLASCRRCGELYRGYSHFVAHYTSEAAETISSLADPDWAVLLSSTAGRDPDPHVELHIPRRARVLHSGVLRAAAMVVLLGLALLFGYRQYLRATARSFVRSDTTEFVDAMFAASIFSTSTSATSSGQVIADSGWFDATNLSTQLALPTTVSSGAAASTTPTLGGELKN